MSYSNNSGGGGSMHKRPFDNAPYQGGGEFPGVAVDIKRSRSGQVGSGGGSGGGGGNGGVGMYGHSGGNAAPSSIGMPGSGQGSAVPRQPGTEPCMNFRRTGTCKFGSSCNYDHPLEGHPSVLGTAGFHAGAAAPSGPTTSGASQSVQHGHGPRQSPQQQPHIQQQQRHQHLFVQQPQPLQQAQASQQQHQPQQVDYSTQPRQQQPPYGQQPQPVRQTSPGQQRVPLHPTPGSFPPGGGSSTGGVFTGSTFGNPYGGGGSSSSTTTPSAPSPVQPPGGQLGSPMAPLPTPFNSAESATSAATNRTRESFKDPSSSIAPKAHGTLGSFPETLPSRALQQGSVTAHAPTKPATATVVPSVPVSSATSTLASPGSWVYDHTTGGYQIAPPPSATAGSVEPVIGVTAAGTSDKTSQISQQRQRPGSGYVTPSTQQQTWPHARGYNGATASHGQSGDSPMVPEGRQQHQQLQPGSSSTSLAVAPAPSAQNSTTAQYSVHPGTTASAPGQPAASASSTAPVSVGYGGYTRSATTTSEYGLQGIPSVYGVPPSALPQQAHGVSNQTPSLNYAVDNPAKAPGSTPSTSQAYEDNTTIRGSSSYGGVSSAGAQHQYYGAAPSTTPAPTAEVYVAPGSTVVERSSQYGSYGASPSFGGRTSASSTSGGQQAATAVSESIPVPRSSHQADAASMSSVINGNRSSASTTTTSLASANKPPSVTRPKVPSAASRGGRSSADAEIASSSAPITAPATSASKMDPMASAAAAYAGQQAAAVAATGVAYPSAPSPAGGSTNYAMGHTGGYMPPTSEARNGIAVAAVSSAGQFVQPPAPDATQGSATGSGHGAANQLPLPATGQNAIAQQQPMAQPVTACSPFATSAPPQHTPAQTPSPHGVSLHLWQQQQQPQQIASGGPGIVVQPPQGAFNGFGRAGNVVTHNQQQQQQQKPHGFNPSVPSYGPQSPAGLAGSSGPGDPLRGVVVGGPGGYPNHQTGPSSHGSPPLQNVIPGMMAAPVMMGGPGMISAPPPQNMLHGVMGPGSSSGLPGGRNDGPVGHPGGRHGGPGGPGGLVGQAPVQYSVERPAPNMPQRSNMPDCHSFVKSGSCRFALVCKYNHPYNRVGMPIEFDDSAGVVGAQDRAPCDVYLNTGLCTFGDKCRFRHISRGQLAMESAQGISHPDPNQLPKRAGHPPCGFYARTGKCAFGMKCKFDHPTHRNPPPGAYSATIVSMPDLASSPSTQTTSGRQGDSVRVPVPLPQPKPQFKSPSEVTARHILVKHKGSRRPASWQDPSGVAIKQRTQTQATATLQALRGGIKTQDDFAKVAMSKSDCSSAKRGGDLGSFARGKMQRAFEDAAFGLQIGSLSGVISTDSGVHVIMRTA